MCSWGVGVSCVCHFCCCVYCVKSKGQYICIAHYWRQPTSKALRYGNELSRDLTVVRAHSCVNPRTVWTRTIRAFVLPAETGPHLSTPKGWKVELAWATRTVSKQSAQDCCAMFIAAANRSKHYASLGVMCSVCFSRISQLD